MSPKGIEVQRELHPKGFGFVAVSPKCRCSKRASSQANLVLLLCLPCVDAFGELRLKGLRGISNVQMGNSSTGGIVMDLDNNLIIIILCI